MPDLSQTFRELRRENPLHGALFEQHGPSVIRTSEVHELEFVYRANVAKCDYATEDPRIVFLEFPLTYKCRDIRGENRNGGRLTLQRDGLYRPEGGTFRQLRNSSEELEYVLADGTERTELNHVIQVGGIMLDHR
jgi:hypothetical protein